MRIRIDPHTLERSEERGATEEEIKDVIETGLVIPARYGRKGKTKVYEFNKKRHDTHYEQKRLEVFYVMEGDLAVTVTVYVFYGKWEA